VTGAPTDELLFREGRPTDVKSTFALAQRAIQHTGARMGVAQADAEPTEEEIERLWRRHGALQEFLAAQQEGSFWVCEGMDELAGFARVVEFDGMEQLTHVMVDPALQGRGLGRGLLERCWPGPPTPDLARLVVAAGSNTDLSLYTEFGVMPVTGHWNLTQRTEEYLERRLSETDATEEAVHALEPARAVGEWQRLEPQAIAHKRPELHEFFARERACLACVSGDTGEAGCLCWVHPDGDIGPAVAAQPQDLIPVVLAALDRVAKTKEPEELRVACTTDSWWLLRRLRGLGFRVAWPSWVLCSVPLPGLDRYVPTHPAAVL
jgi:GNAT superfamily N-acetyltransferase